MKRRFLGKISLFILFSFFLVSCNFETVTDLITSNDTDINNANYNVISSEKQSSDDDIVNDLQNESEESVTADLISDENSSKNIDGAEDESVEKANTENESTENESTEIKYVFRNNNLLKEHFQKHGQEFPYDTKEDYLLGANIMLDNPNKLHKTEKEDGDDVYYLEETNEFIIVSTDGYLRTYFKPSKGKKYFDRQ